MALNERIIPIVVPRSPSIVAIEAIVESAFRLRSRMGLSSAVASSIVRLVSSMSSLSFAAGRLRHVVALETGSDDVAETPALLLAALDGLLHLAFLERST